MVEHIFVFQIILNTISPRDFAMEKIYVLQMHVDYN